MKSSWHLKPVFFASLACGLGTSTSWGPRPVSGNPLQCCSHFLGGWLPTAIRGEGSVVCDKTKTNTNTKHVANPKKQEFWKVGGPMDPVHATAATFVPKWVDKAGGDYKSKWVVETNGGELLKLQSGWVCGIKQTEGTALTRVFGVHFKLRFILPHCH